MFYYVIIASLIGGACALIGGVLLFSHESLARRLSLFLVSFAAGSLLAVSFFDLIPEALEEISVNRVSWAVILGMLMFFILERFLHWYHCHEAECEKHVFSSSVIIGDTLHNFMDGIAIAASFLIGGVTVGVATTAAIFFHEVPQEIGDFGVLLYSGFSKKKIFLYNFFSSLAGLAGAILGYFFLSSISAFVPYVMAFTAGNFIYIAASDIIPEVHHKAGPKDFSHVLTLFFGVVVIFGLGIIMPE